MQITTNNQPRELISAFELPSTNYQELRKQFDYLDDQDFDSSTFFTYKGEVYCLADFIRLDSYIPGNWQGVYNFTYGCGLLVKIVDSCQSVVVGTYTC